MNIQSNGKNIKIFLFLSIIINFLLIGYLIGNKSPMIFKPMPTDRIFLKEIFHHLPKESKDRLSPIFKKSKYQLRENLREIHNHRHQITILLKQDNLDEIQLKFHLDNIHRLADKNISLSQTAIYEAFLQATPQERKQMAENLSSRSKFKR